MERFSQIDWNPPLEDVIDNTFINEERLERESVMHRILIGKFKDPFADIDKDYESVNVELLGDIEEDSDLEDTSTSTQVKKKKVFEKFDYVPFDKYVPGVVKSKHKFPKKSKLSREQQAMCLKVLLKFSESEQPKMTQANRQELQEYLQLRNIISEEQEEFLKFAKSKWSSDNLKIMCEDYINTRWKSKVEYMRKLPRYYTEVMNVPFVASKSIAIKLISVCSQVGDLPRIELPTFDKACKLYTDFKRLNQRFPPKNYKNAKASVPYKLPVSQDPHCQQIASENDVDLVISSSGLKCLINNIEPNYSNSWILPIVVRMHNGKNIIYIDKAAPPTASTIPEKNAWIYKYILRQHFVKSFETSHMKRKVTDTQNDDLFGDTTFEALLKLEEEYDDFSHNANKVLDLNLPKQDEHTEEILAKKSSENDTNPKENNLQNISIGSSNDLSVHSDLIKQEEETKCKNIEDKEINEVIGGKKKKFVVSNETHVSYKLFSLGPNSTEKNELMKNNVVNEYKILIRTKNDGVETLENGAQCSLMLAPKLEHQVALGAEAVTMEEALNQWISLKVRPNTFLARVRISAETSEALQIERRTEKSVSNEIKRLYNVKAEDSLTVLHNVIQSLKTLLPGSYIMRHTIRNGAFASVLKEVQETGKNIFDLHTIYVDQFRTIPNCPWPLLDKTVATPMLKVFERMPAMFYPPFVIYNKKEPYQKPGKIKEGTLRRSLRNQEKEQMKKK